MEQAVKDSDRDQAQAFLLATDAGKLLYEKIWIWKFGREGAAGGKRNTTAQMRKPQLPQRWEQRTA
jgi:hypothetical protein